MSLFSNLGTSVSGLKANQRGMSVTSHNISNANTEGYTRQRVEMSSRTPSKMPGKGTIGNGVNTNAIKQIRDGFLDKKYREQNTLRGGLQETETTLKEIETIFNEPSDTSISTIMDNFYESLHELNKNPESNTTRTLVRQRGISLTKELKNINENLKLTQKNLNDKISANVSDLNSKIKQIKNLNKSIFEMEIGDSSKGKANDLRDKRNVLLDKLSKLGDVNYYEEDNKFHVSIGGKEIINHDNIKQLNEIPRTTKLNNLDMGNLNDLEWDDGDNFTSKNGKIKALKNLRDNVKGDNKGIPYYVKELSSFANTFISEVNNIHKEGFGLNGETNINMFSINGLDTENFEKELLENGLNGGVPTKITDLVVDGTENLENPDKSIKIRENINSILKNNDLDGKTITNISGDYYVTDMLDVSKITISKDMENLNNIAASTTKEGLPGNGQNALFLTKVRNNSKMYDWGTPEDYLKSLISNLGVDSSENSRMLDNQETLLLNIDNQRLSVSGVSIDEEMAKMITYEKAYAANAKVIQTIDKMLGVLINLKS